MSPRQALASALHLFVVLSFFLGGCFFVSIPYLPEMKTEIFEKSTLIGLSLFLASLILLLGFYALDRGRYLVIKMGEEVKINLQIIHQTLEECFIRNFPQKIHLSEVEIGPQSLLEIQISLAPLSEETREDLFIEVENHLSLLLHQRFGYSKQFRLIVNI